MKMNEEKYVNGELIIAERMEDEEWYSDYQMLMGIGLLETNKNKIIKKFQKEWKMIFGTPFENTKRLDMWAEWIAKSNKECLESDEYKRMLKLEKKNNRKRF